MSPQNLQSDFYGGFIQLYSILQKANNTSGKRSAVVRFSMEVEVE
jgi:hypothetical protein